MASENITDRSGRVIGRIVSQGHFDKLLDNRGYQIGYYDRNQNTTHDAQGRFFSRGDQLMRLL